MQIDSKKVNLEERDLEDWLYENPGEIEYPLYGPIKRWIARQYKVPSGIIDLLGMLWSGDLVVVELKNRDIDSATLTQASRYAADIEFILPHVPGLSEYVEVFKVVVGTNSTLPTNLQFEADALSVKIYSLNVELKGTIGGPWSWTEDAAARHSEIRETLATDDTFSEYMFAFSNLGNADADDDDEIAISVNGAEHISSAEDEADAEPG